MSLWTVLLVAATSVHAGFQLTVSAVVYPTLVRTPPDLFAEAHARHSRAIIPVVALVYGCLVVAVLGAVATMPQSVLVWAAAGATACAFVLTGARAAPLHARLGRRGADHDLLRSLLRIDRLRTVAALVGAAAAVGNAI